MSRPGLRSLIASMFLCRRFVVEGDIDNVLNFHSQYNHVSACCRKSPAWLQHRIARYMHPRDKYVPPQDLCGVSFKEPRWRTRLRRLLRAYWKHIDIADPREVMIQWDFGLKETRAADAIVTRCETHVSWTDWLRLLFGCRLVTQVVVYTERQPGAMKTEASTACVL